MGDRKLRPDTGELDPKGRFGAGNGGRPRGARNKINQRLEALFARDAEAASAIAAAVAAGEDLLGVAERLMALIMAKAKFGNLDEIEAGIATLEGAAR